MARFAHGVASGDATQTSAHLWTHVTDLPEPALALTVRTGGEVVSTQQVAESEHHQHVFRADVEGLVAGTTYDYEFAAPGGERAVGRFRTLPPDGASFRFGVASCAKFNSGFFNTYRKLAERDDLDFVLHLGDYIYEASQIPRGHATPGADIGRPFEPEHECVTYDDYWARYRQYRSDTDLLALHAKHTVISTLDDHELADNAWAGGAEEHREERDGAWADRVDGALRAWEYWMPTRLRPSQGDSITRSFDVAGLARFVMLETRLRRDPATVPPERRSALGAEQIDLVESTLDRDPTPWAFVACPSMLSPIHQPELADGTAEALRTLKLRHPDEDRPYHDRWDSFPAERDRLLEAIATTSSKVAVLSGDVHIAVDAALRTGDRAVAREWTTSSITSPNLADKKKWARHRESLPVVDDLVRSFPDLDWVDTDSHGYLVIEVRPDGVTCEWWALDTVLQPSAYAEITHRARLDAASPEPMRVLVAPDKFAGTLTAVEAAAAIADGWSRQAPEDELDLAPMSDGGPGFVDVLHAALGGELLSVTVAGPHGAPTPATVLSSGPTAYVESAQACGLHLTGAEGAETATTRGVGELVVAALEVGATTVVVGLGGSGTNDGGAGLLAALGAAADAPLDGGPAGFAGVTSVDLSEARARVSGVRLVAASDVDSPLTGLFGATKTFGPQKGIPEDRLPVVDGWLEALAVATDRRTALEKGAGAAGGLGFGLLLLGATRESGVGLVADAVRLAERAAAADLVLTGEGAFDFSSRAGKVPYGVAEVAQAALRPCVALAGQVLVGSREMRALGIESAYSLADLVGEERALGDPAGSLSALAERVARTWSR